MNMPGTLQVSTPSDREILVTRAFNAPRALVFDAFTRPELLLQWFNGPEGWRIVACELELQVGSAYRYTWEGPEGERMSVIGTVREVAPPERFACTEAFEEAWYPGESLVTSVFTEEGGRTLLTMTIVYESLDARDAALASGMEEGMAAGYDSLAAFLAALPRQDA